MEDSEKTFCKSISYKTRDRKSFIYILLYTFIFASLITFIIEKLDDVFHNPKEVEKFIQLPILGYVPFFNFSEDNSGMDIVEDNGKKEFYYYK